MRRGGECRALRGLLPFLRETRAVLQGVLIETGHASTRACCTELTAPGGAFALLRSRHSLCPRYGLELSLELETLCRLASLQVRTERAPRTLEERSGTKRPPTFWRDAWPWEITFLPCVMGSAFRSFVPEARAETRELRTAPAL